jgi:chondroitin 4-sulfotransferase 11
MDEFLFVHINKTAGSSIESALGLPARHCTVDDFIQEVGIDGWSRSRSFAFVRNPWDRVVSHYHWRVHTNQTGLGDAHLPFGDWVLATYRDRDPRYYDKPRMFMPQLRWLTRDERGAAGPIEVGFVGRFEHLLPEFSRLCEWLGFDQAPTLPHLRRSGRPAYRPCYDLRTRRVVEDWFKEDLEILGYDF